ncbi:uncharacterized protein LOC144571773 [Carex rostrata]
MKKIDPTRKRRVEMSSEEQGEVGEGSSPRNHCDMHVEEYNPLHSSDGSSSEGEEPQKKKKKKKRKKKKKKNRKMDSNPAIHSRVCEKQGVVGEGSSHQNLIGANHAITRQWCRFFLDNY